MSKRTLNKYLQAVLTPEEFKELKAALSEGQVIIVNGIQGPTGKSTLVEVLRKNGYCAFEGYDVFEIELNKPLQEITHDLGELVEIEKIDLSKMMHRRFKPLKEDMREFARVMNRNRLTREDLKVILTSIELSEAGEKMIQDIKGF